VAVATANIEEAVKARKPSKTIVDVVMSGLKDCLWLLNYALVNVLDFFEIKLLLIHPKLTQRKLNQEKISNRMVHQHSDYGL
jgi:hypothetical protein